jgi:hypothetical protein
MVSILDRVRADKANGLLKDAYHRISCPSWNICGLPVFFLISRCFGAGEVINGSEQHLEVGMKQSPSVTDLRQ